MNRQHDEEPETQLSRNAFSRALKVEGLENRVLLAADLDSAVDASACMTDDASTTTEVPAEVGQADAGMSIDGSVAGADVTSDDGSSDVSSSASVDAQTLDEVMAEIGANAAAHGGPLAAVQLDLPSGQSYDMRLFRTGASGFRLMIMPPAAHQGLMTAADASANASLSDSLSTDSTASVDATTSGSLGLADFLGSSSVDVNASASGSSSLNANDTLVDEVSTDMAAPMVLGPMSASSALDSSVDANLSGGVDLSTVRPSGVNLGLDGTSFSANSAANPGLTTALASPGLGTSMSNPGLGTLMTDADLSGSVDAMSDMNSGLRAEGEWSNGWAVTGTHYDSDPTPEELYFRSVT